MNTNIIIEKLREKTLKETDKNGYLSSMNPEDNLYKKIDNWNAIKVEIENGQGSELTTEKSGRMKFCALHSSAALCVNNFAMLKQKPWEVEFLEYKKFSEATFEKKLSSGISTPNLDFYLENDNNIIGIESKFTEYLTSSINHTKENLSKYFMREELDFLPRLFDSVILNYINSTDKMYLNVAQLIKHSIGLLKRKGKKKAILVYIYWTPKDLTSNSEYKKIYEQHKYEIEEFEKRINKFLKFEFLSYTDFWEKYGTCEDIKLIKEKYEIEI